VGLERFVAPIAPTGSKKPTLQLTNPLPTAEDLRKAHAFSEDLAYREVFLK
jgi:hypothetical protein